YREAIEKAFGQEVTPPRTGKPGRPAGPRLEMPAGLNYATLSKRRQKGRVNGGATPGGVGAGAAGGGPLGGGGRRQAEPGGRRRRWQRCWEAGRSARRTWRGSTAPTATAAPARPARRIGSARAGRCTCR